VVKREPKVIGYELPGDYQSLRTSLRSTDIIGSEVWFKDNTGYSIHIPLWVAKSSFTPIYEEVEPTAWEVFINACPDVIYDKDMILFFNATFELKKQDKTE
jgi:hypothetical protein